MSNMKGSSVYIATDKNIYDALQHKKITQLALIQFLRKRGIFYSSSTSKDELVDIISSLTLDYEDYKWICQQLENPNKKEKSTHSTLKGGLSDKEISDSCNALKANLDVDVPDDSVVITKTKDKTIVSVTYVDIDFTKTELRQRSTKKCEIELHNDGNELTITHPSSKKAAEVTKRLKTILQSKKGEDKPLKEVVISLENISDPETRSKFFAILINNIEGYKFDTVSNVDVYHHIDQLDEDDDDEQSGSSRLAGYINKAALSGEGVLESAEFKQLHNNKFFIYRAVWTVTSVTPNGDKVEIEALFGTPSSCTNFKYLVRGYFNYNENHKGHVATRKSPSPKMIENFNKLIKKASESAFASVKGEDKGE